MTVTRNGHRVDEIALKCLDCGQPYEAIQSGTAKACAPQSEPEKPATPRGIGEFRTVQSSNVHGLHYDATGKRLYVAFKGEMPMRVYQHEGVSQEDYDKLLGEGVEGHSVGSHYAKHIRDKFPSSRVEYEQ